MVQRTISSVRLGEYLAPIKNSGVRVWSAGRTELSVANLQPSEMQAVNLVVGQMITQIRKISPKIAADLEEQQRIGLPELLLGAGLAQFTNSNKTVSFPSQSGMIGILALIPGLLKYVNSATSTNPAYTGYTTNSWDIATTAGTAAYIVGTSSNYYKANPEATKQMFNMIFQNGLVEVGSTPVTDQFLTESSAGNPYSIYTEQPFVDQTLELDRTLYQYESPYAVPLYNNQGAKWSFMPYVTGTHTIRALGLSLYEHELINESLVYLS